MVECAKRSGKSVSGPDIKAAKTHKKSIHKHNEFNVVTSTND